MSFLVTARKWRPQRFEEVIGQESVSRTLQNALRAGRIAHAYIFSGPRGIGKTTTARLLAKAINCVQGPTPTPCNQCVPCQEIPEGRSLDVLEIDGASNRGVGEIRNLRENIRFNPVSSHRRIYIIDEVHMLTIEAFNALLKTLEEPPEHALFIFATTEINRVPATILSRCQRFDFRRLATVEIAQHLRTICTQEQIVASTEALELLARRADGAMRDAQSLLDQLATFAPEGITEEQVRLALGVVPEDLFFRTSSLVFENNPAAVFSILDEVEVRSFSPREYLRGLSEHYLNLLKAREKSSLVYLEAPREVIERYSEETQRYEVNDLLRILALLHEALTDIRRHPQPGLKLELTLLRLATLERTTQIEALLSSLQGEDNPSAPRITKPATAAPKIPPIETQTKPVLAEAPPTYTSAVPVSSTSPLDFNYLRANWQQVVDQICDGKAPLACQLKLGRPEKLEQEALIVSFGADLHDLQLERLQKVASSGGFDQGLNYAFGVPIRLRFERHAPFNHTDTANQSQAPDALEQELMRTLGAKRIA